MMPTNAVAAGDVGPSPQSFAAAEGTTKPIVVDTRFGRLEFDPAQTIDMPRGMMGFPDNKSYALTALPDPRIRNFMLYQSLTDSGLSFLTLPLSFESGIIDAQDLGAARRNLGIASDDFAAIVIVSIRNVAGKAQTSINLRAPVFLDARNRTGWQYVMPNASYAVRHAMSSLDEITPADQAGGAD